MGRGIPERWDAYSAFGTIIRGTRFLPFKVPLKESLCKDLPADQRFTPGMLIERLMVPQQQQPLRLGLVIDLTNTNRYYSPQEITKHNVRYEKIFTEGHNVPGHAVQRRFKEIVDRFLWENSGNGLLIGVHCTHGVNRTGYLVCRYMIDRMHALPAEAIQAFNEGRGHVIERENYLEHLSSVSTATESSNGELRSAASGTGAAMVTASAPVRASGRCQPCPGSDEQWPQTHNTASARQQQSRREERRQAQWQQREAGNPGCQQAKQHRNAGMPPAEHPGHDDLAPAAASRTGSHRPAAVGAAAGRQPTAGMNGIARQGYSDGHWSSPTTWNRPQARKQWASKEEKLPARDADSSGARLSARAAADTGDSRSSWDGRAGTSARRDRPFDDHCAEWTGLRTVAAHRDSPPCRTFSDPGPFRSASLPPHSHADLTAGGLPWQQQPPGSGRSRHDDRASLHRAAVRPTIPGYCPVVLGSARVEARELRWQRQQHRGGASQC